MFGVCFAAVSKVIFRMCQGNITAIIIIIIAGGVVANYFRSA